MQFQVKKVLFQRFLQQWESQIKKVPFILDYLTSYSEFADKLDDFHTLGINDLIDSQTEWIALVAQLDNSIEITFFKDYWVPIQKDGYDYFIDLSSESLPLFEIHYFFFEPYRWYKKYIFKDLSQFLVNIDNPKFSVANHFEQLDNERWSEVSNFFNERDKLGFEGKLELNPIQKESIFCDEYQSKHILENNSLTIHGVNSLIVGLLPHECLITLESFITPFNKMPNVWEKVTNIKALIYLLQSVGWQSIDSYLITFDSNVKCNAEFKNNTFGINHTDNELLVRFKEKYETLKNS